MLHIDKTGAKDDFLIIGFTGPFCSGCSTAAKFFEKKWQNTKKNFVACKDEIDAQIANWYFERETKSIENRKEIIKLLRRRQVILALSKIDDKGVQFYYIPMTKIMNILILKTFFEENLDEKNVEYNDKYLKLINFIKNWVKNKYSDFKNLFKKVYSKILKKSLLQKENFEEFQKLMQLLDKFKKDLHDYYIQQNSQSYELFNLMQSIGNNLRKSGHPFKEDSKFEDSRYLSILAEEAGIILKYIRDYIKENRPHDTRTFFVIECFRNPAEINYFRRRFYEFYLFSVFADEKLRFKRAKELYKLTKDDFEKIDQVDKGTDNVQELYKQNVTQCVNLSDIAVTNQGQKTDFYHKLLTYYALIKVPGCIKPTHMERNMHLAYSMSLNSTCICRQVGAVIVKKGHIIGAGWNDTEPRRIGCTYRLRGDIVRTDNKSFPLCSDDDYETFKEIILNYAILDHSFCYKDEYAKLKKKKDLAEENIDPRCQKYIDKISTKSLQQCRALHAEENAILQTAGLGGVGLEDATIYTTTFPCELCAKKIARVGIKRIIYCEPYPKSVSMEVFLKEGIKKIDIIPFEGVKSPSFFRLFKPYMNIKELQELELIQAKFEKNKS